MSVDAGATPSVCLPMGAGKSLNTDFERTWYSRVRAHVLQNKDPRMTVRRGLKGQALSGLLEP